MTPAVGPKSVFDCRLPVMNPGIFGAKCPLNQHKDLPLALSDNGHHQQNAASPANLYWDQYISETSIRSGMRGQRSKSPHPGRKHTDLPSRAKCLSLKFAVFVKSCPIGFRLAFPQHHKDTPTFSAQAGRPISRRTLRRIIQAVITGYGFSN